MFATRFVSPDNLLPYAMDRGSKHEDPDHRLGLFSFFWKEGTTLGHADEQGSE